MTDFNPSGGKAAEPNASQISADLATLREDFAKLSSSVAELVKLQAAQAGLAHQARGRCRPRAEGRHGL